MGNIHVLSPRPAPAGRGDCGSTHISFGSDLTVDGNPSYDQDQMGQSISAYDWDLNGDGIFEASGASQTIPWADMLAQTGTTGSPYSATLRVTDNEGQTATQSFSTDLLLPPVAVITVPVPMAIEDQSAEASYSPIPPPFMLAFGSTLSLDGSTSHDIDQAGPTTVSYRWDLNGDGYFGGPLDSIEPSIGLSWDDIINRGGTAGDSYSVTLEVTDNEGQPDTETYVALLALPPTVTVKATDPLAGEAIDPVTGETDTGTFTFTRARTGPGPFTLGLTSRELTVSFTMTGTATNGGDYTQVPLTVTIPAGRDSTTVTITPNDDGIQNIVIKTAVITIDAKPHYIVGTPATDTVKIRQIDGAFPPEFLSKGETDPRIGTNDKFNFYMNVDTLNSQIFSARSLTAADPDGEPMSWSIQGGDSGLFSIDAATGAFTYTGPSITGRTFTFNATVTSNGETDTAVVKVAALALKSIDFTTDHGLLRRDIIDPTQTPPTSYASQTGARFHPVEWMSGNYADPLTHTMNTEVGLTVILEGIPTGVTYKLVGDATVPDPNQNGEDRRSLDFEKSGASGITVTLTAKGNLPEKIGKLNVPISWTITIDGEVIPLRDTQNKIYLTYGKPAGGVVTEHRITWLTSQPVAEGKGFGDEQKIVAAVHTDSAGYGVFESKKTPIGVWSFMDGVPGECKDHVKLIAAAVAMLGVPGGKVGYVYPRLNKDDKGIVYYDETGSLTEMLQNVVLHLGYQDKQGGLNNYEAVYEFTGAKLVDGRVRNVTSLYAGFDVAFDPTFENEVLKLSAEEVLMEALVIKLVWLYSNQSVQREAPRWP